MSPFFFSASAATIALLFMVAAAMLWRQSKTALSKQFIFYLLACVVWLLGNTWADLAQSHTQAFIASGLAFIGGCFIATFFLIFIYTFIHEETPPRWYLALSLVPGLGLGALAYTPLAIKEVILTPGEPSYVVPGVVYSIALGILLVIIGYGLIKLWRARRGANAQRRLQITYIAMGFVGVFIGQLVFTLLLPIFGQFSYYNVAPQFTLIFALASGYAIYRHNLLDIRVVVQRGLIYTILITFIAFTYIAFLTFTALFFDASNVIDDFFSGLLTTIIGIFTVPRLDAYLRRKTDRIFFKDRYDYADALRELSSITYQNVEMNDLISSCEEKLSSILRASRVAVETNASMLSENDLSIPIINDGKTIAYIMVSEKRSGDAYTPEDIQLLETFAYQASTAIGRALLFQEVKEYAEELEQKVADRTHEIKALQEKQRDMMLYISHDLQTPLTIFQTKLEALKRESGYDEMVTSLETSLHELSGFISDLLRFAKLETGREEFELEDGNVTEFMDELIDEVQIIADSAGVSIERDFVPNVHMTFDPKKLREVIMNLASNAIKYRDTQKKNQWVKFSGNVTEEEYILTVSDNGLGISAEDLPHIFDHFYRVKGNSEIRGTGLGLAVVHELIKLSGGTISAESTPRVGTTFTITVKKVDYENALIEMKKTME